MANKTTNEAIARNMIDSLSKLLGAKVEIITWVKSTGQTGKTIKLTTEDN